MLIDAEALMLEKKIKALLVVDTKNNLVGILEIFDR
jgi:CBS domain-containing protein